MPVGVGTGAYVPRRSVSFMFECIRQEVTHGAMFIANIPVA